MTTDQITYGELINSKTPAGSLTGSEVIVLRKSDGSAGAIDPSILKDYVKTQLINAFTNLGINATSDLVNRLAVNSASVLFNHDGSDSRVKINKNATGDTASVLLQKGFSGRAEVGLAGDDDVHVKVSPDGSTWHEAFLIDKDTGNIHTSKGVSFDAGANLLNKYEEGSWTPTIYGDSTAGSVTYTAQVGSYQRIGNLVYVTFRLGWSAFSGAVGNTLIGGLPFAIKSGAQHRSFMGTAWYNSLNVVGGSSILSGFGQAGGSYIILWLADTPESDSNNLIDVSEATDSGEIYGNLVYLTSQ